ncbi:hypothetical protein ACFB49_35290 [Sphingomonas sp. DBB INV C78]|uniref:hypothetical protein n=1 Tax=Sphingomonas sp. DBB INV C78 TaxID=3349434 RepID=UPI0036D323F0
MQLIGDVRSAGVAAINSIVTDVANDPSWLAHRYDPEHDAIHFQWTPREAHRAATFITDEYLPENSRKLVLRRDEAVAAAPPEAPIHFLFHSAFCCSTLLARAFDREGWAMGLKEPVILNDLVGWRRRGGEPRRIAMVLDHSLHLLGRSFASGEAVVVKPSNVVNVLATAMLGMRPNARALLLHAPLETYLASIAKKGMTGRIWARDAIVGLLMDGAVPFGFDQKDYLGQTDLQVAAIGWLAQHANFHQLIERLGPDRVRTLDSQTLLAHPAAAMRSLAQHYGLALDDAALTEIMAGPAFTRHSKFGSEFASSDREAEYRDASAIHADEIKKVTIWAAAVAESAGLPMALGTPLLS